MYEESDFAGQLVEQFASYHRQSYACKAGAEDVLIGAAQTARSGSRLGLALGALITAFIISGCGRSVGRDPNIVFILIDDLGWADTGVYGSTFYETPNIDRLASEGARFTQFYTASPVCSPTRASIQTGKDPARLHLTNWIGGEQKGMLLQAEYIRELPPEEFTVGEAFKGAGYATGYIGKWHLGQAGFLPDSQGYDFIFAVNHAGQPGSYFYPYENENRPITNVPDLEGGHEGDYLTDRLTNAAVSFIEEHRDEPFFLMLAHYAVHTPLQSKAALTQKYTSKAGNLPKSKAPSMRSEADRALTKQRQDHPVYAGMIESMDESVGRVIDELDELGLTSNTVVVFVSDNGGLSTLPRSDRMPTSNLPLRAGKGWLYDGGTRVPMIIRWPGTIERDRVIEEPAITMDLYPTLLEIAGLPLRPDQHLDGTNLAPLLLETGVVGHDELHWHFPHYHGSGNVPSSAIRIGDYKLIEWLEDGRLELYDLKNDPGESMDLSERMPGKTADLEQRLDNWRRSLDAGMPTPNPDWNPGNGI
jgi:arylsulfatase A-like enzyme